MSIVHKKSRLVFTIKKGSVHFAQQESYVTGAGDQSIDKFFGECPLDSSNLKTWLENVSSSWIDGDSIRDDAVAGDD